jgi:4-hydroxy-3-methylbut-2-en-1-yl diphosphate reductase
MIIKLAEHYGLCFGVRDAIAQAERLAQQGPLTILGELVHNPVVRARLADNGVKEASLDGTSSTPQVMITAHGASDTVRDQWRSKGYGVADGTCPLVRHAHEQLRVLVQLGYSPVIIGKHGHVEVLGLSGDFPNAVIIEVEGDIHRLPATGRFGVISQTTQPIDRVTALIETMRAARPDAEIRFVDTVCQPTKSRQSALQKLLVSCDTLVVVGGRNSNNTRQLVAAAEAAGRKAIHIERATELDPAWFKSSQIVGLTAGTSTLKETVAEVHARLRAFAEATGQPAASANSEPNKEASAA